MGYGKSSLLCVVLAVSLCSTISALDITAVLGTYPDYAQFSKSLTETKLAEQINTLNAVTILALDNAAMASLAGKPVDVVKSVLSNHILRHFYDMRALSDAQGSKSPMETISKNNVYVSLINEGEFAFGSATEAPGVVLDVLMMRSIEAQPGTVYIYQVTKPIDMVPHGLGASKVALAGAQGDAAMAPAPAPSALAPGPSSGSSRVVLGFFGVVSVLASLLVLA